MDIIVIGKDSERLFILSAESTQALRKLFYPSLGFRFIHLSLALPTSPE